MKVKICGLKEVEHVTTAIEAGADYLGFVFAPSSRRISIGEAHKLAVGVPASVKKIGVFVNATLEYVKKAIAAVPLDMVQLHGDESLAFIQKIEVPVVKAISVKDGLVTTNLSQYPNDILLLLDTPADRYQGGSGKQFDWQAINPLELSNHSFIIAGGLTPETVQQAIVYFKPMAFDVSSGVETNGRKDSSKITQFIANAKGAINYDNLPST